jgi:uncharacterized membrane protein YidH (DUF202 family)
MAEKKDADQTDERATEVREHLANERTLLSWVRTGVGLISLGIVVERAGALVSQTIPGGFSDSPIDPLPGTVFYAPFSEVVVNGGPSRKS